MHNVGRHDVPWIVKLRVVFNEVHCVISQIIFFCR
jgi:hypothetical protein